MSRYELLLFLHVSAVIVWLGAGTTLSVIGLLGESPERMMFYGRTLGQRVFGPSSMGALVFGLLLVWDGHWGFHPLWIQLGMGAFVLSALINAGFRAPASKRVERGGTEAARAGRALYWLSVLDLTVLYLAVADMVAKPTGDDTWTLAVGGAILALAAIVTALGTARTPA